MENFYGPDDSNFKYVNETESLCKRKKISALRGSVIGGLLEVGHIAQK